MNLIVGIILLLSAWSLSEGFTWSALAWVVFSILILSGEAVLSFFSRTERFIHRDKR